MNSTHQIQSFLLFKERLDNISEEQLKTLADEAFVQNNWFTLEQIKKAFLGISFMLNGLSIAQWLKKYDVPVKNPKKIGITMAGNIPLVGFHDLLCVIMSGHKAIIKPSNFDKVLVKTIVKWLIEIDESLFHQIEFKDKFNSIDAVIATGSDNTSRYFEYYFRNIPRIIRKNRTSLSILTGDETPKELQLLGKDIFDYFGLGCRNVSKILLPKGYDFKEVLFHLEKYKNIVEHHKYRNNYEYNKAIFLINKTQHLDNGFLLCTYSSEIVSPISVLYLQEYTHQEHLKTLLNMYEDKIQCIIGHRYTPYGTSQRPTLWDFSDGIDTMNFLEKV